MTIKLLTDMMVHVLVPSLTLIYSGDIEVDRQRLVDEETKALKTPKVSLACPRVCVEVWRGMAVLYLPLHLKPHHPAPHARAYKGGDPFRAEPTPSMELIPALLLA